MYIDISRFVSLCVVSVNEAASDGVGGIVGGVLGALIGVILIAIIVVGVVIGLFKVRRSQGHSLGIV